MNSEQVAGGQTPSRHLPTLIVHMAEGVQRVIDISTFKVLPATPHIIPTRNGLCVQERLRGTSDT